MLDSCPWRPKNYNQEYSAPAPAHIAQQAAHAASRAAVATLLMEQEASTKMRKLQTHRAKVGPVSSMVEKALGHTMEYRPEQDVQQANKSPAIHPLAACDLI